MDLVFKKEFIHDKSGLHAIFHEWKLQFWSVLPVLIRFRRDLLYACMHSIQMVGMCTEACNGHRGTYCKVQEGNMILWFLLANQSGQFALSFISKN